MAAGGSAPELFTSFLGVFVANNDVGFGTIVGSAVFNVLFVIGMCAFFSSSVLELTWWPLARDCSYYSISLCVLAIFFQYNYDDEASMSPEGHVPKQILWWEALVLFLMYIGYVTLMYYNERLQSRVTTFLESKMKKADSSKNEQGVFEKSTMVITPSLEEEASKDTVEEDKKKTKLQDITLLEDDTKRLPETRRNSKTTNFLRPSQFRTGLLHLMISDKAMAETAGIHVVSKFVGNAQETFRKVAQIYGQETSEGLSLNWTGFQHLLRDLKAPDLDDHPSSNNTSTDQMAVNKRTFDALDVDQSGSICESEFMQWYHTSENRLEAETHLAFELTDADHSGTIDLKEFRQVLNVLQVSGLSEDAVLECFEQVDVDGNGEISWFEFNQWYRQSLILAEHRASRVFSAESEQADQTSDHSGDHHAGEGFPAFPRGSDARSPSLICAQVLYLINFPIIVMLYSTIPNVNLPQYKRLYTIAFFGSIWWIGVFSYFMVWWAGVVGDVLDIPPKIMGLTFLAAGTSGMSVVCVVVKP